MSLDEAMGAVMRGTAAAEGLAAIGARLRARTEGIDLDPAVAAALDQAVAALGVPIDDLSGDEAAIVAASIQGYFKQAADLLEHPGRPPGWGAMDDAVLLHQGRGSAVIAGLIAATAPQLDGLAAALDRPGAAFCDVGSGVAALSVALCRRWPQLRVVGLDPLPAALRLAAITVAQAGLGDRIELRATGVEELRDEASFDAVWMAGPFLPSSIVPVAVERAAAALRPGGWLLFGSFAGPDDAAALALLRLRVVRAGGHPLEADEAARILSGAGLAAVRVLERTWTAPVRFVVGQREAQSL